MQSKTKSEKFFSTATQSLTIEEELALLMRDHSPQALLNEYYNKKKKTELVERCCLISLNSHAQVQISSSSTSRTQQIMQQHWGIMHFQKTNTTAAVMHICRLHTLYWDSVFSWTHDIWVCWGHNLVNVKLILNNHNMKPRPFKLSKMVIEC